MEKGYKYCTKTGQRIFTVVVFLHDNINYTFDNLKYSYVSKKGSILLYNNIQDNCNDRNSDMIHSIANNNENDAIILNLYVREKSRKNKSLLNDANIVTMIDESVEKNINLEISEVKSQENYMETYEKLFQDLQKNKVNRSWNNKSLTFTHKLKHEIFLQFLNDINNEKNKYENRCLVNEELLEKEYVFDQYHPVSVNNVLKTNVNDIFKALYKNAIKENVFPLGDRQSNRYKSQ